MKSSTEEIDLSGFAPALWCNRWRIGAATLISGVLAFAYLSVQTPQYRSAAEVLITNDESSYTRRRGEEGRTEDAVGADVVESQVQIIRSRDLLSEVARSLKLAAHPDFQRQNGLLTGLADTIGLGSPLTPAAEEQQLLDVLEERLTVSQIEQSRVITIAARASEPQLAADIANGLAATYLASNRLGELKQDTIAADWIGGRLDALKREAETAEAEFEKRRAQSGVIRGDGSGSLDGQQLKELTAQLGQLRILGAEANARAASVRVMLGDGSIDASPDMQRSPVVQKLVEQKGQLERDIAQASATLLPAHPRMRQLGAELARLKAQLRDEGQTLFRSLDSEARIVRERQETVSASIAALSQQGEQSSGSLARLSVSEQAAKSKRDLYETYLDRFNDARARRDQVAGPANARQTETAHAAGEPYFPKTLPITALVMAATALGGIGLTLTRVLIAALALAPAAARDPQNRVRPPRGKTVTRATAVVPREDNGAVEPLRRIADTLAWHGGARAGAVRTLVTTEVLSHDPAEAALALGRLLAAKGERVVVVDWADGLGDDAGKSEAGAPAAGIGELLQGKAALENVIFQEGSDGPDLIAAGSMGAGDPRSETFGFLIDALDEGYRQIIFVAGRLRAAELLAAQAGAFDVAVLTAAPPAHGHQPGVLRPLELSGLEVLRASVPGHARRGVEPVAGGSEDVAA